MSRKCGHLWYTTKPGFRNVSWYMSTVFILIKRDDEGDIHLLSVAFALHLWMSFMPKTHPSSIIFSKADKSGQRGTMQYWDEEPPSPPRKTYPESIFITMSRFKCNFVVLSALIGRPVGVIDNSFLNRHQVSAPFLKTRWAVGFSGVNDIEEVKWIPLHTPSLV
jgi:hypothetical protein